MAHVKVTFGAQKAKVCRDQSAPESDCFPLALRFAYMLAFSQTGVFVLFGKGRCRREENADHDFYVQIMSYLANDEGIRMHGIYLEKVTP